MLRSKATAALLRLKEMDRKYNIKCIEGKRGQSNVSTESSIDDTPRNLRSGFKASGNDEPDAVRSFTATDAGDETRSKASSKSKIQVKIPSLIGKGDDILSSKNVSTSKKSSEDSFEISIKTSVADESRDVQSNGEDVSMTKESPKALSSLESTLKEDSINVKAKVEVEASESVDRLKNSDESSVATILSEASGGSKIIFGTIRSVDAESSTRSNRKSNVSEEMASRSNDQESNAANDEATIDEVIGISGERSEIISELSHATDKDDNRSKDSSRVEQKEYESDTFEEAGSSTASTSSAEDRLEETLTKETFHNTIRSGVKQIMITPHKQVEGVQKIVTDDRDKEIIELVAPKIMQNTSECDIGLDEELSNYVKTMENVDEILPISLLKISKQTTSARKQVRRNKRHRKSSNENTSESLEKTESPESSVLEKLTIRKENKNEDYEPRENSSATIIKDMGQKNEKEIKTKETSLLDERSKLETVDAEKKTSENDTCTVESKTVSSGVLLKETPKTSDVTCTLRELNRDAIDAIARRHRIIRVPKNTFNKSRYSRKLGTIVKLPSTEYETPGKYESDESRTGSLENVRTMNESSQDQRTKKRNKSKRISKASKIRKPPSCGKVEEKQSRFDCKQSRRLRKQAAALRLHQERQDIRNYLLELECTRLEFGPGNTFASSKLPPFKPLEFPKIATFEKPEPADVNVNSKHEVAGLQERISTIKQWLKDQYVLYRDYSSLAQTMNAKYIPASLEDAKRTIRQLQKATIKTR
ncbi:uncharacterized protein LOC122402581 [Colletes gigas]|uniref:uncharacterized protein LOC122402581 n=1 Tax=Colletes gigas TaxID=935657 RepID=UPI001C9AE462|nr:uncharacterized protein LOC122402581 [Colletes gigas]